MLKVIKPPSDKISKLWAKPEIKTDSCYRLMDYVLTAERGDTTILHNCVTGEMIALKCGKRLLSRLPAQYTPDLDLLIEKHFLVPCRHDDKKVVLQIRNAFRLMYPKKDIIAYTILPTSGCNARCFYCYECGIKHINMSPQTADRVVDYIKEHHGDKEIILKWFGGEPLLNKDIIDQICRSLKENGIAFTSNITTNGLLFSKELVSHGKENWNLKDAQITVDGTEEVYNKTKSYINASSSPFYTVMDNIQQLLTAGIAVKMRMNLSKVNGDDLKELIDYAAVRFKGEENFMPYVTPIYEGVGYKPIYYSDFDNAALELKKNELNNLIKEYGFKLYETPLPALSTGFCMADNDAAVLINPEGGIGKCEHHIFDSLIGSVYDKMPIAEEISLWKQTEEFDICESCPLFPTCFMLKRCDRGGCNKFKKNNRITNFKESILNFYNEKACEE